MYTIKNELKIFIETLKKEGKELRRKNIFFYSSVDNNNFLLWSNVCYFHLYFSFNVMADNWAKKQIQFYPIYHTYFYLYYCDKIS